MQITIRLRWINYVLVAGAAALALAGLAAEVARHILRIKTLLIDLLSLSGEANIPTWYSSSLLLSCAVVLGLTALVKRREGQKYVAHWVGLALIFLYISMDETAQIHENLNELKSLQGHFYFAWVIPAVVVVLLFALSYLKFLFHLPPRTRWKIAVAGCVYVGGALGVEFVLGHWSTLHGEENFGYAAIDAVQETMEIVGTSLFLSTLLEHLGGLSDDLRLRITSAPVGG